MHVPAFILKNYIPVSHKVEILHQQYGKIMCIYPTNHQAAQLTIGSLIICQVTKFQKLYRFDDVYVESACHGFSIEQLTFIHEVSKICLQSLPPQVNVPELFDFLLYLYKDLNNLSVQGRCIALLRIFLMLDLLPSSKEVYYAASLDPYGNNLASQAQLNEFISRSWDNFYAQRLV